MSAFTLSPVGQTPDTPPSGTTDSDMTGGGAGRGGAQNPSQSPLVVVQGGRQPAPPRPAASPSPANQDNTLRNGYAAISHSVSGETAAIGLGFLIAGPVGAIVGGTALPALAAASLWRARRREDDANTNSTATNGPDGTRPGSTGRDRSNGPAGRTNGPSKGAGGSTKTPKSNSTAGTGKDTRKPRTKDPVADKLAKTGKDLADKLKNRDKNTPSGKKDPLQAAKDAAKNKAARDKAAQKAAKEAAKDKAARDKAKDAAAKAGKDKSADPKTDKDTGTGKSKHRKWPKDRGPQPASDRPWRQRGTKNKPEKDKKDKPNRRRDKGDTPASSAPDGLDPKDPKGGPGPLDGQIERIRNRRERKLRRQAITTGKKAADQAAKDGTQGDPHQVKLQVIREENRKIDLELHHENELLALAAATEHRRSTPVHYPAITTAPPGTRTAGVAVARQIDPRGSSAYALLRAMGEQLANGLHNDADADMADHIVELTGIPNMCRNLSVAVREAADALAKTAPLHPSVAKHLKAAAVAALTAARMADTVMVVFVQAHREDILRVMSPRLGEERWNIRNAPGTLDAARLRAAIASAHTARKALPAGKSSGGGKLVPASDGHTRKLIDLMKGFDRGHMVACLSEVAGSAAGVEVVADSITRLYRRMSKTWPTEQAVDDTVRGIASKVYAVGAELRRAIKAAQRAHQRDLRLNAKPRKGPSAEKKWDVAKSR